MPGRRPYWAAMLRGWTSLTTTYWPLIESRMPLSKRPNRMVASPATRAMTAMTAASRSMVRWSMASTVAEGRWPPTSGKSLKAAYGKAGLGGPVRASHDRSGDGTRRMAHPQRRRVVWGTTVGASNLVALVPSRSSRLGRSGRVHRLRAARGAFARPGGSDRADRGRRRTRLRARRPSSAAAWSASGAWRPALVEGGLAGVEVRPPSSGSSSVARAARARRPGGAMRIDLLLRDGTTVEVARGGYGEFVQP